MGICIGFAGALPVHAQSTVSMAAAQCEADACGCGIAVGNYMANSPGQLTELSTLVAAIEGFAGGTSVAANRECYSEALRVIADRVTASDPGLGANLFDLASIVAAGPFEPGQALADAGSPTGTTGTTTNALGDRDEASGN